MCCVQQIQHSVHLCIQQQLQIVRSNAFLKKKKLFNLFHFNTGKYGSFDPILSYTGQYVVAFFGITRAKAKRFLVILCC